MTINVKKALIPIIIGLAVSATSAKIKQTFILDGNFAVLLGMSDSIEAAYTGFRPGFAIGCSYILTPFKYIGGGARLSYTRFRNSTRLDLAMNNLGMAAVVRPQYPFETNIPVILFAQAGPGVYRIVAGKDDDVIEETFFDLEMGGGVSIGSVEFGVNYNMSMKGKYDKNNSWLTIFAGLRLEV